MNIYVKNVLIALTILIVLVFVVLQWLNFYTRHGKQVAVPDVKGMQVEQAAPFFTEKTLQYLVVDSIYIRNKPAGSILETVPPVGTNVKEGRTIYLTVNSSSVGLLTVPQVTDMSGRQAEAILRSLGFGNIRTRIVPGAYRDLVTGLESIGGNPVAAGSRIPAATVLVLLVNSGQEEILISEEGESPIEEPEEYWY